MRKDNYFVQICLFLVALQYGLLANDNFSSLSIFLADHAEDYLVKQVDHDVSGSIFVFAKGLRDIQGLDGHKISMLSLRDLESTDVNLLSSLPLNTVWIEYAPNLIDISPIAIRSLKSLLLFNVPHVRDISSLNKTSISSLNLIGTGIDSLDGLRGLKLTNLVVSASSIESIAALQGMPLLLLSLKGTSVSDLTPLKGMPLKHLELPESVSNLSPITNLPLQKLWISETLLNNELENLQKISTLQMLNGGPISSWRRTNRGFVDLHNRPSK